MLEDPEPREGSGPALRAGLKAPWRVSAPSSCKGALKLARGRRKGGCLASWVSQIILVASLKDFSDQKVVVWARTHNRMGLWVIGGATQIVCDALGGE